MSNVNFEDIAQSKNQIIVIEHVTSGKKVEFPAFLTAFSDQYGVQWSNDQIFGRQDPIKQYQSTSRTISIGFDILADDEQSARSNLAKYSLMIKMLYPTYSAPLGGAGNSIGRTIKAPPIVRMRFVNMIQSVSGNSSLLGCIDGLTFSPVDAAGYFYDTVGNLFPKHYKVDIKFTPQHEDIIGWDETNQSLSPDFPYSVGEEEIREITGNISGRSAARNNLLGRGILS